MTVLLTATESNVVLSDTTDGGVDFFVFDPAAVLVAALGADSPEAQFFCGTCAQNFPAQLINSNSLSPDDAPQYACMDAFCMSTLNLCEIFVQWLYSSWWASKTGGIELACRSCAA